MIINRCGVSREQTPLSCFLILLIKTSSLSPPDCLQCESLTLMQQTHMLCVSACSCDHTVLIRYSRWDVFLLSVSCSLCPIDINGLQCSCFYEPLTHQHQRLTKDLSSLVRWGTAVCNNQDVSSPGVKVGMTNMWGMRKIFSRLQSYLVSMRGS